MSDSGHDEPEQEQSGSVAERSKTPAVRERRAATQDSFFGRTGKFIRDTRGELGRVAWPSALQVRNTTIITVIAVIFFAVYLYAVDRGFAFLIEQVQRLLGAA